MLNIPYRAGCQPAANGMTWIVTLGCPAASIRCSIWSRMTLGPPIGRRSTVSSRTTQYAGRVGPRSRSLAGEPQRHARSVNLRVRRGKLAAVMARM